MILTFLFLATRAGTNYATDLTWEAHEFHRGEPYGCTKAVVWGGCEGKGFKGRKGTICLAGPGEGIIRPTLAKRSSENLMILLKKASSKLYRSREICLSYNDILFPSVWLVFIASMSFSTTVSGSPARSQQEIKQQNSLQQLPHINI